MLRTWHHWNVNRAVMQFLPSTCQVEDSQNLNRKLWIIFLVRIFLTHSTHIYDPHLWPTICHEKMRARFYFSAQSCTRMRTSCLNSPLRLSSLHNNRSCREWELYCCIAYYLMTVTRAISSCMSDSPVRKKLQRNFQGHFWRRRFLKWKTIKLELSNWVHLMKQKSDSKKRI